MSNPGPAQEEYGNQIYKLATLESELGQARKLLEAPANVGWWRRFWGLGVKVAMVALVAILLLPEVSHALTINQKTLVGQKGVYVLVEDMNPKAERLGLTKAQIQMDVELRLRKAGVRVLTEKEKYETPGMPWLYVRVSTVIRPDIGLCAFFVSVELKELVMLKRGFSTRGAIWDTGGGGSVGIDKISQIRGSVNDLVDEFVNDYLAANPKK